MAKYKVESAMKTGEWTGQGGLMHRYAVQFEGESEAVEMSQKPETAAPKPGDEVEGEIEDTKFGRRFKKAYNPSAGGGRAMSPQQIAALNRQSALSAAATVYTGQPGAAGENVAQVLETAQQFYDFIVQDTKLATGSTSGQHTAASGDVVIEDLDPSQQVDLNDIPF